MSALSGWVDLAHGLVAGPWLWVGLAVLVLAAVGTAVVTARPRYQRQAALYSPAERRFLAALGRAVAGQPVAIYGKVRVADLLTPAKTAYRRAWWKAFTRISSKHIDFVLVHPETSAVLVAIELDDRSHDRAERRTRDQFLDRAFREAGLPLIRIKAQHGYNTDTLREEIRCGLATATTGKGPAR